jgi:hypothetical protein
MSKTDKKEILNGDLISKIADMEGDIVVAVTIIGELLKGLGITDEMLTSGVNDDKIQKALPVILGKLTTSMLGGTLNMQSFGNIKYLTPIIEKYKHLNNG